MNAIAQAIKRAGGQSRLAAALGVTTSAVNQWASKERSIPAARCPSIEGLTGVRCEELRPDIPWHVLRGKPAPRKRKAKGLE